MHYNSLLEGPHDRHNRRLDCAWALGGPPLKIWIIIDAHMHTYALYALHSLLESPHDRRYRRLDCAWALGGLPQIYR